MAISKTIVRVTMIACIMVSAGCHREIRHGPGAVAPGEPVQRALKGEALISHGDFMVEPLATYDIRARVLSTKRYRFGKSGRLAPIDLALGWGRMSDETVLDRIEISQFRRYYWWTVDVAPIPPRQISRQSANVHVIPATKQIKKALARLRTGDVVSLDGYLVRVGGPGGFRWSSSLTRDDTGNGACELFWVRSVTVES